MALTVEEAMARLLACAEDALDPKPGRSQIVPGAASAWDDCCESRGQLSVRLASYQPVYPERQGAVPCGPLFYSARIGVEVVRCVSTVNDRGQAPSPAQVIADSGRMVEDMNALRTALLCCETVEGLQLESWEPAGPEGGCAGGEWIVRVRVM